jgi:hypothetical protein
MENELKLVDSRKLQDVFTEALKVAQNAGEQASKMVQGKDANDLNIYSVKIQAFLNSFLEKGGLITQQEVDALDEQVRLAKLKMLEEKSKNTFAQYGMIVGGLIFTFGVLWLLTKNKNNG